MGLIRKRPPFDARELKLCEPKDLQRDLEIYGNYFSPNNPLGIVNWRYSASLTAQCLLFR